MNEEVTYPLRLDQFLARQQICTSRSEAVKFIQEGRVKINGVVQTKPSFLVASEPDSIDINRPDIKLSSLVAQKIDFNILYEDDDVLVLEKPAGLVVHPGAGNYDHSLVHGLLHHCKGLSQIGGEERPGIVHRLDKGTSGVMVVAKNDNAHHRLTEQFQNHSIYKKYLAVVVGKFPQQELRIENLMKRSEFNRKKFVVNSKKGKKAISFVKCLATNERASLVEVEIKTGRTHQVRVHLSHCHHPILGDELYGGTKKLSAYSESEKSVVRSWDRPLLHAMRLDFNHPRTNKRMTFVCACDDIFKQGVEMFLPEARELISYASSARSESSSRGDS